MLRQIGRLAQVDEHQRGIHHSKCTGLRIRSISGRPLPARGLFLPKGVGSGMSANTTKEVQVGCHLALQALEGQQLTRIVPMLK